MASSPDLAIDTTSRAKYDLPQDEVLELRLLASLIDFGFFHRAPLPMGSLVQRNIEGPEHHGEALQQLIRKAR